MHLKLGKMEYNMMVNGKMIKKMDTDNINVKIFNILEIGKIIKGMEKEFFTGFFII